MACTEPAPTRIRAHLAAVLLAATACVVAACSRGPVTDRSRFVTAALCDDGRVVFTFADVAYRPAQGIAAFPDGGIATYVRDRNVIGVCSVSGDGLKVLHAAKNEDFQNDAGHFHILETRGPMVLLNQGGQLRGPFAMELRHWILDLRDGSLDRIDLSGELARRGRALAELRLADDRGALLVTSVPAGSDDGKAQRVIRVRYPDGEHVLVAATNHFERIEGGRVVYWMPGTRQFMAFDLATRETSLLPGYRTPGYADVTRGVTTGSGGAVLRHGVKRGGVWQYTDIPVSHDDLR